ncbi:aminotransferase class I/II-fold pyridoxal phosphate-dependent enzyme [Corynebacterium incognita]|uniref:8-amino-7-oxononanoate synthase n=1 Tax=Corynebacterium incognita TaxID=2754725 RepID=A0A7G7CMA7_9CORY|nr:aminotransferase class I/II-fold pyridoxal phosphate-dependent enzyme [Corynebacterium incognita]QNE88723.1 aminotransferase class I/II-fold pyridoxal phosphate-dependent enzyme [Corynebacterium incognita]
MHSVDNLAHDAMEDWAARELERAPRTLSSAQRPRAVVDGKEMTLFSSSNYLGLAHHPAVIGAARDAIENYGVGAGGSRLTTGNLDLHQKAERALAAYFRTEDAVLFPSGYQANVSVVGALAKLAKQAGTPVRVFSDEKNHASLIDGVRREEKEIYAHLDLGDLRARLEACPSGQQPLVVTDGVFSMDGDLVDYPALRALAAEFGAWLLVDDAHGVGSLGRGVTSGYPLPDILIGTASKALGAEGGFACCSAALGRFLRHQARGYVFSTAPSPAIPAAIIAALGLIPEREPLLRERVARFRGVVGAGASPSPIIPIHCVNTAQVMRAASELADAGFMVTPIRYPTVPRDEPLLRICIMATHQLADLDSLASLCVKYSVSRPTH